MARQTRADLLERARGRWPAILGAVAGIGDEFLTGEHGPCPLCGGTDRWRWDDKDGEGGGYCNQCSGKRGAGGAVSGIDLVMQAKGLTFPEACNAINDYLGGDVGEETATAKAKATVPWRKPEVPPEGVAAPALGKATGQWPVQRGDGHPLFWIQRVPMAGLDKRGKAKKRFVHRVWLDGGWHYPSTKRDGFTCEWSTPRPHYGVPELLARPEAPVLLVEGETTMDAAKLLLPDWVVVAWPNGSKAVGVIDWSPMTGRRVVIWPDNDKDGQVCAVRLVNLLYGEGAESVAVVKLPKGLPVGWDLGDADDWTGEQVEAWIADHASVCAPEGDGPSDGDGDDGGGDAPATATEGEAWPFTMLGFNGDDYFYQPGESGQVTKINKNAHTTNSLIALADLGFWARTFPRVDREGNAIGIDWKMALNTLFRRQHRVGCYDPSRIRGIGAWWDGGRPVFHLGDRLVADGRTWPVLEPPQTDCLYQRLPRREGPGAAVPLGDQEGLELIEIAEGFHWESKTSGALLAGWTALAPICGALDWRPHVWLNAAAGSGKSSLMDLYVGPLLTDMGLFVLGNTTEAGIRQKLKSDALPVIFDEAESNEKRDLDRMQNVLGLARSSSSEGRGTTVKGSASSEAMMYNVRSMFMLSSINMSLKQGADRSRFSVLSLRVPDELDAEGKATHWRDLKARLVATVNSDTGRRLVARMVNLIPEVRLAARVLAAEAALALDGARAGDQIGALLAGAWCLQHQQAPTAEQARAFVAQFDWAHHGAESDEKASDQKNCLQVILQSRIRLELEKSTVTRTVAELIEAVQRGAGDLSPVPGVVAAAELARHGLLVRGSAGITVSNTAEGVKRLLRDTQWASGGWATLLRALPGARRTASAVWFPELKAMARGTEIPNELLEKPLQ